MNLRGEIHQEMETVIEMSRQVTDFIPILDRVGKEVDRLNKQFGADKK